MLLQHTEGIERQIFYGLHRITLNYDEFSRLTVLADFLIKNLDLAVSFDMILNQNFLILRQSNYLICLFMLLSL